MPTRKKRPDEKWIAYREKSWEMRGNIPRPGNKSRKATRSTRVIHARWKHEVKHDKYGGQRIEDRDLASLEAKDKVVNEGAVVELIRRRYSQNKIYVSNILAAKAGFFYLAAAG